MPEWPGCKFNVEVASHDFQNNSFGRRVTGMNTQRRRCCLDGSGNDDAIENVAFAILTLMLVSSPLLPNAFHHASRAWPRVCHGVQNEGMAHSCFSCLTSPALRLRTDSVFARRARSGMDRRYAAPRAAAMFGTDLARARARSHHRSDVLPPADGGADRDDRALAQRPVALSGALHGGVRVLCGGCADAALHARGLCDVTEHDHHDANA
eukprot:2317614-Rhodomonas_salina.1